MIEINKKSLLTKIVLVLVVFGIYLFVKPVNSFINQMVHYLSMLDLDSLKEYI